MASISLNEKEWNFFLKYLVSLGNYFKLIKESLFKLCERNVIWSAVFEIKWRYDPRTCWTILSNCLMNLKNSGDSTGIEPMTSAMLVQCSNQLSYKVTQLRADQFIGLMFSRERNVVWKKCYMKCGVWNQMKISSSQQVWGSSLPLFSSCVMMWLIFITWTVHFILLLKLGMLLYLNFGRKVLEDLWGLVLYKYCLIIILTYWWWLFVVVPCGTLLTSIGEENFCCVV